MGLESQIQEQFYKGFEASQGETHKNRVREAIELVERAPTSMK